MDIIATSLEALIQRATSVSNQGPDTAAIDAFCGLVNKEPESVQIAAKFIAAKVHSLHEWEALQALFVLETCMKRCGSIFHAEVGKFKFLNELIKLVSPKYLGAHTPEPVRRRVLELMHFWTVQYPKETKFKEAYDMLKKQGVVKEEVPVIPKESTPSRQQSSIQLDEKKSQLLQKLLQSKNPEDLQAANLLIKSMVKEDERRLEEKWRHAVELETVVNNSRLLKEMLDNYHMETSSVQDLELIKELYSTCQNLRPVIFKLATSSADPAFCTEVLTANDELGEVFSKYNLVIEGGVKSSNSNLSNSRSDQSAPSLLDLTPSPVQNLVSATNQLSELGLDISPPPPPSATTPLNTSDYLSSLDEIFSSAPAIIQNSVKSPLMQCTSSKEETTSKGSSGKIKGLEELDMLGESLLKESLSSMKMQQKKSDTLPVNSPNQPSQPEGKSNLIDDLLKSDPTMKEDGNLVLDDSLLLGAPDLLSEETKSTIHTPPELPKVKLKEELPRVKLKEEKDSVLPLGDLHVALENVKPSSVAPFVALDNRNDINVVVYLTQDHPRPDVSVFVVTTSSKSESSLSNFLFQPVVPKTCRLRLLPPSSTSLPAHNPFLPPSVISQVMLIGSPSKEPISLKFVISYVMDEENVTEMGEISDLPLCEPIK